MSREAGVVWRTLIIACGAVFVLWSFMGCGERDAELVRAHEIQMAERGFEEVEYIDHEECNTRLRWAKAREEAP